MTQLIYKIKILLLLMIVILYTFACTKNERSERIKEELSRNDSVITVTNNAIEEYKYIINKRSGKIHTYSDGINRVSERYQLMSNENIEKLLENENYDICLNCRAGLKLNLDAYEKRANKYNDEDDLSNREVNLIKNYMRLYEFGQLDTETQKFLICLFEVSSWYVNNVYTQLGGKKNVLEVENIAKASASNAAYKKWRDYLDRNYYNKYSLKYEKRILPVIYDDNNNPTDMVLYRCDLFKDANYGKGNNEYTTSGMQTILNAEGEEIFKEWKNYCVVDDSSKFAAAVYYHYINKEILKNEKEENRIAYGIDLWETSSMAFSKISVFTNKLFNTRKFEIIEWNMLKKIIKNGKIELKYYGENFKLQPGDLLYRQVNYGKKINGHVDFFLNNNNVISWGRVNKKHTIQKQYTPTNIGYISNDINDKEQPFVTIIRFIGE